MTLVVVPTPIGNLEDITLRALRCLREADLVACEDTRRTGRLLTHHGIRNHLLAYHEHNEERLAAELTERARTQRVALVSDAGMPLVSDPGYRLVSACIEAGIDVEVLPGPSAPITALVASGLPADTVVFLGFLPRRGKERVDLLACISKERSDRKSTRLNSSHANLVCRLLLEKKKSLIGQLWAAIRSNSLPNEQQ